MHKVIFLDRDGVIIEDAHYLRDPKRVQLCPNAVEGIKIMRTKGYTLFVVSNQSGVGRGYITMEEYRAVHERCVEVLASKGTTMDGWGYYIHAPDIECECRKPNIGMVVKLLSDAHMHRSNLDHVVMIGDRETDIQLGKNINAQCFLVLTGKGSETYIELLKRESEPPHTEHTLLEIANLLP